MKPNIISLKKTQPEIFPLRPPFCHTQNLLSQKASPSFPWVNQNEKFEMNWIRIKTKGLKRTWMKNLTFDRLANQQTDKQSYNTYGSFSEEIRTRLTALKLKKLHA